MPVRSVKAFRLQPNIAYERRLVYGSVALLIGKLILSSAVLQAKCESSTSDPGLLWSQQF